MSVGQFIGGSLTPSRDRFHSFFLLVYVITWPLLMYSLIPPYTQTHTHTTPPLPLIKENFTEGVVPKGGFLLISSPLACTLLLGDFNPPLPIYLPISYSYFFIPLPPLPHLILINCLINIYPHLLFFSPFSSTFSSGATSAPTAYIIYQPFYIYIFCLIFYVFPEGRL